MSVLHRFRARLLLCVAALAALGALAFAPAAGANDVGNTYLALGDSLAYGYHQAQFQRRAESQRLSLNRLRSTTATSMTLARR